MATTPLNSPTRLRQGAVNLGSLAIFSGVTAAMGLASAVAFGQWGMGFNRGGYASTAGQAAAYGMSEMMRAQGYANLENSEAAKNWQEVKSMEYDNRKKWTETFFENRKMNREYRAAEEGPRVTQEQAIRLAKMAAPPRLTSTELDPTTGYIQYPVVLTDKPFDPYREKLDSLFARRASTGGSMDYQDYTQNQVTVDDFLGALKSRASKYAAGEYGRARSFLESLAHEMKFPAG
jgi:hypothetical protein